MREEEEDKQRRLLMLIFFLKFISDADCLLRVSVLRDGDGTLPFFHFS